MKKLRSSSAGAYVCVYIGIIVGTRKSWNVVKITTNITFIERNNISGKVFCHFFTRIFRNILEIAGYY